RVGSRQLSCRGAPLNGFLAYCISNKHCEITLLLRKSTQKKSGFSVPTTGGSKINRVGGNGGMWVPLSELQVICGLYALRNNLAQNKSFSYPTRTRFLLEARINRLE